MFKKLVFVSIVMGSVILSGCASTMPISAENKQSIHTVSIVQDKGTQSVYYMGGTQGASAVFGIVGELASAPATISHGEALQNVAAKNNIDIQEITTKAFAQQLEQEGFKVKNTQNTNAQMHIQIRVYGFSIHHGFETQLYPVLSVHSELIKNNQIVWSNENLEGFVDTDTIPTYTYDQLISNPENIKQGWTNAANGVAKMLLSNL